jgi:hypothetical protein
MNEYDNETKIAVIFRPPKSQYPDQPKDISKCELTDCPTCKNPMWFSEKKKHIKDLMEKLGREIIFECYICFSDRVNKDRSVWNDYLMINL